MQVLITLSHEENILIDDNDKSLIKKMMKAEKLVMEF